MGMAEAPSESGAGIDDLADEILLERFISQREEAAFAALVRRYGPLVLGVCRRVLHHEQDAEDAFQAVFCVLSRKAVAIRKRGAVGAWLHAVAHRIARRARADRGRRRMAETNLPDLPAAENSPVWVGRELRLILDEEVSQLPEKFRRTFVLCYLEGKTNEQAAAELGRPLGTVLSRLARARERLRIRLIQRGVALSGGTLAAVLSDEAMTATVSPNLTHAAVRTAIAFWGGAPTAGGVVPAGVATLAQGFLNSSFRIKLLKTAGGILALVGLVTVLVLFWPPAQKPRTDQELLQGTWKVSKVLFGGQEVPKEDIDMIFVGDQFTVRAKGAANTATFRLNPTKDPKEIDVVFLALGVTWPGIYRLEGDHLLLCMNTQGRERPADFTGRRFFYYEVQRQPEGQR
jgi:RNA polymerase sigma factor (sigma-70 family)